MPQVSSARQVTMSGEGKTQVEHRNHALPGQPRDTAPTCTTHSSKAAHTKVAAKLVQELAPG